MIPENLRQILMKVALVWEVLHVSCNNYNLIGNAKVLFTLSLWGLDLSKSLRFCNKVPEISVVNFIGVPG